MRLSRFLRLPLKLKGGGTLIDDSFRMYVRGGTGGNGLARYGGIGGTGGDVYVCANPRTSITRMRREHTSKRFIAGDGFHSSKIFTVGARGRDLIVDVPIGVTVCTEDDRKLGNLNRPFDRMLVASGGEGGSAANDWKGQESSPRMIHLILQLVADVGLVGFPNAGKSTLLKAMSRAKPKISAIPFTTLRPQVGILQYEDFRKISVADLPGLIEGAYKNVGLGHKFLRHIERTLVLLVMVDVNGFKLNDESPYRSAFETLVLLNRELELYDPTLLDKPAVLCINKMDSDGAERKLNKLLENLQDIDQRLYDLDEQFRPRKLFRFCDTFQICAREGSSERLDSLKIRLREIIDFFDEQVRKKMRPWDDDEAQLLLNSPYGKDKSFV